MSWEMQSCIEFSVAVNSSKVGLDYVFSKLSDLSNNILILLSLPIWNHLVFPLLGHYLPNTRKRIGLGMAVSLFAGVVAILSSKMPLMPEKKYLYFLAGVIVLLSLGETFVFVPSK